MRELEGAAADRGIPRWSWHLVAIGGVLFLLAYMNLFLRSSLGVMAPALTREMALSPAALSTVASAFFLAYAAMQLPTGMLLDRFGTRLTIAGMLLFTTAGAATFAAADSVVLLCLGRVLMGIGCAGIFTGAFYVLAGWLAADRVVTLMGTLNTFAAAGTLTATTPLAALIALIGWRECYGTFTVVIVGLLAAVVLVIRDSPRGSAPAASRSETVGSVIGGVGEALRQRGMLRLLLAGLPISASTTVTGVWGAPYLQHVHGLDVIASGNVLLAMALCAMAGHTVLGLLARYANSVKTAMLTGMSGVLAAMAGMASISHPPVAAVTALFCLLGFSASFPMIVFAHARGLVAPHLMGRGLSAANMGLMAAIALMQLVFGWIVGFVSGAGVPPTELAYRTGFGVQAAVALVAILSYLPISDVKPRA
ncbi:MAG: MFS transporter [Hyphomicrobiaceae bacterium]